MIVNTLIIKFYYFLQLKKGNKMKNYSTKEIHEHIKIKIKEKGTTAKEIAKRTGINEQTIVKWKTSYPKINLLIKVADELECTLDELIGRQL